MATASLAVVLSLLKVQLPLVAALLTVPAVSAAASLPMAVLVPAAAALLLVAASPSPILLALLLGTALPSPDSAPHSKAAQACRTSSVNGGGWEQVMAVVSLPAVMARAPVPSVAVPVSASNSDSGSAALGGVVVGCSGDGSGGGDPL